jgi:hypothetical protein
MYTKIADSVYELDIKIDKEDLPVLKNIVVNFALNYLEQEMKVIRLVQSLTKGTNTNKLS